MRLRANCFKCLVQSKHNTCIVGNGAEAAQTANKHAIMKKMTSKLQQRWFKRLLLFRLSCRACLGRLGRIRRRRNNVFRLFFLWSCEIIKCYKKRWSLCGRTFHIWRWSQFPAFNFKFFFRLEEIQKEHILYENEYKLIFLHSTIKPAAASLTLADCFLSKTRSLWSSLTRNWVCITSTFDEHEGRIGIYI